MAKGKCSQCGGKHSHERYDYAKKRAAAGKEPICFTCNFWNEYVDERNNPNSVRVNGEHYFIGDETPCYSGCRGYGGRFFRIRFNDGREVTTTNLWHQGKIPSAFTAVLADNATFVEPSED